MSPGTFKVHIPGGTAGKVHVIHLDTWGEAKSIIKKKVKKNYLKSGGKRGGEEATSY